MAVKIVYWTQSGSTGMMATAVAQGIKEAGAQDEIIFVSDASVADLQNEKAFALGCPAMGDEVLEETEMEPFVEALESFVAGKTIGLFGSYGWGDGQWMRDWTERMKNAGATIAGGEGIIACGAPDEAVNEALKEMGRKLAGV